MYRKVTLLLFVLGLAAGFGAYATPAQADEITYRLSNHPGGSARPPTYGLRIDEFDDCDDANPSIWTFDFNDSRGAMYLTYDTSDGSVRIHGTTWGGLDNGSGYDVNNRGLFTIDYTYSSGLGTSTSTNVQVTGAKAQNGDNTGTITFTQKDAAGVGGLSQGYSLDLVDWSNGDGLFFRFLEDNHRLPAAYQNDGWFVGRGWLGVDKGASSNPRYYHTNYQDWLFIGRPVPEPGTLALLGLGLVCVAAVRRSRMRAS